MRRSVLQTLGHTLWRNSAFAQSTIVTGSASVVFRLDGILQHAYSTTNPGNITQVFQSLQNAEFQKYLDEIRATTTAISFPSLVSEFRNKIPAASEEEAQRACQSFIDAGSVVRYGDLVFLKPEEVADALDHVMPAYSSIAEQQLEKAKADLDTLEGRRLQVERWASIRSALINWGFFGVMAAQWGVLFRLTYWELSWDVMEPIICFMGGFTSLASYAFYLITRRDFSYEVMRNRFVDLYEERLMAQARFDPLKYRKLKQDIRRYSDILKAHGGVTEAVDDSFNNKKQQ